MSARRVAAIGALLLGLGGLALAVVVAVQEFPRGLIALACVAVAAARGLVRRSAPRRRPRRRPVRRRARRRRGDRAARRATACSRSWWSSRRSRSAAPARGRRSVVRAHLPQAPAPQRPVLFFNPKSGGGKAERFSLATEARARGIEPIELGPPWDLEKLVRDAVAGGADGLAMAGGDGSQAIVAAIAAELDLPYACVPAGTRNHFALDLGVDRDDVVGALDAFVDGGERRVDLAEVNGRVFVNNVSLGLYADAVQRKGYRDAKLRTLLDTVPDVLGPDGSRARPALDGPGRARAPTRAPRSWSRTTATGSAARSARARARGSTTGCSGSRSSAPRPVAATGAGSQRPWREWTAPAFEVDADRPVPAGIDGEAVKLEPPLRFRIRPGVLRVRIARRHPGASPSAMLPEGLGPSVRALAGIAAGRDPASAPSGDAVASPSPNRP